MIGKFFVYGAANFWTHKLVQEKGGDGFDIEVLTGGEGMPHVEMVSCH